MKRYRVIVTPRAVDNIRDAYRWFRTANPDYADRWRDGIEEAIHGLSTMPEAHGVAPESSDLDDDVRQLLFGSGNRWRIFYVVDGSTVRVLHVRHASRGFWRP